MFDIQHSDQQNITSYKNYPADRPFINTKWIRPTRTLSKAYPESNRDIIMSSLKKLQEKINRLELDPSNNNNNNTNRDVDERDDRQNIEMKTTETEDRILKLEHQLEKMRRMVNENEANANANLNSNNKYEWANKRLSNLEKDALLYDTEQYFTDKNLLNLEQRLAKNTTLKARDRETPIVDVSVPRKRSSKSKKTAAAAAELPKKKSTKSCRKHKRSHSIDSGCCVKTEKHYRLNLGEIPFVVGKSITPSHHLGSNIQNVISLLKLHHPKLCNSVAHNNYKNLVELNLIINSKGSKATNGGERKKSSAVNTGRSSRSNNNNNKQYGHKRSSSVPPSNLSDDGNSVDDYSNTNRTPSPSASINSNNYEENVAVKRGVGDNPSFDYLSEADLKELLRRLQAEYTQLVLEHYEITKRILNCLDEKVRDDYELKAKELDLRMRKKAKQINKLKNYQRKNFANKKSNKSNSSNNNNNNNKAPKSSSSSSSPKQAQKKILSKKQQQQPTVTATNSQLFDCNHNNNNNNEAQEFDNNNNNHFISKSMNNHDFFVKYSNLYPPSVVSTFNSNNLYNSSNANFNEKNHYKSLKLFKDIKTLKTRIENDQIEF